MSEILEAESWFSYLIEAGVDPDMAENCRQFYLEGFREWITVEYGEEIQRHYDQWMKENDYDS